MIGKNILRTIYFLAISLLLFLMIGCEPLVAGNNMNISNRPPQILPSFNTLGFQIRFSGDDNNNGSATIRYRVAGGAWQQGHPCIRIWYSEKYEWAGRIFHLEPGTRYEIEVRFADPDGVMGKNPLVFTATSRDEPVIENRGGKTYHVSPSGSDRNNGSQAAPFKTIEKGINKAEVGCTIIVHEGIYRVGLDNPIRISKSGTARAPIIIKAAEGEKVIIDSYDSGLGKAGTVKWRNEGATYPGVYSAACDHEPYMVFYKGHFLCLTSGVDYLVNGKYQKHRDPKYKLWEIGTYGGWYYSNNRLYIKFPVILRNWNGPVEDPSSVGVQVSLSNVGIEISGDHVVLDGFIIQHLKRGIIVKGNYVVIRNTKCRANDGGILSEGYFTLIDRCEVGCSLTYWYREWELGHDVVTTSGVRFKSRYGGNCVLRNSRIYGVENGVGCTSPWSANAFGDPSYSPGVIIMNNEFELIGDDAVETDGPGYNFVIYGNYFHHCFVAISSTPLGVGPIWVIRNKIYMTDRLLPGGGADTLGRYGSAPNKAFKFSSGGRPPRNGKMFIYHNSSLVNTTRRSAPPFASVHSNAPGFDVVLRNNSFTIKQGKGRVFSASGYARKYNYTFNIDMDYDNLKRHTNSEFAKILKKRYKTFARLQADGYELHGMSKNPMYVNPQQGDFRLTPGSPLIDAGVWLPGINDGYNGSAPDIGALEYGRENSYR